MTYLADVNVWLALTYPDHQHHAAAEAWLSESLGDEIAFCRTTQSGLLRLLTNQRVMGPDVLTAEEAWEVYNALFQNTRVVFANEPLSLERQWRETTRLSHIGPNFWTDAYLAAFALAGGYTVVTFDRGFKSHKSVRLRMLA